MIINVGDIVRATRIVDTNPPTVIEGRVAKVQGRPDALRVIYIGSMDQPLWLHAWKIEVTETVLDASALNAASTELVDIGMPFRERKRLAEAVIRTYMKLVP